MPRLHVGPGVEVLARARQDSDPGVIVQVEPDQRLSQFDDILIAPGVASLRRVQGEVQQPFFYLVSDICHRASYLPADLTWPSAIAWLISSGEKPSSDSTVWVCS